MHDSPLSVCAVYHDLEHILQYKKAGRCFHIEDQVKKKVLLRILCSRSCSLLFYILFQPLDVLPDVVQCSMCVYAHVSVFLCGVYVHAYVSVSLQEEKITGIVYFIDIIYILYILSFICWCCYLSLIIPSYVLCILCIRKAVLNKICMCKKPTSENISRYVQHNQHQGLLAQYIILHYKRHCYESMTVEKHSTCNMYTLVSTVHIRSKQLQPGSEV